VQWSSDAPLIVQVIDQPDRLRRLLPHLQDMLRGGLMTLHDVDVLKYTHARRRGLSTKLPVRQVMGTSIMTVHPDTPVAMIVGLLLDAPFRVLPVIDVGGKLQGIISTGDLINAGILPMRRGLVRTAMELDTLTAETIEAPLEQARNSARTAQDVMNRQVRTVGPNQSIREAAEIMLQTGLRRLPVIETNGVLVGMLTRTDLLQAVVTSPLMSSQEGTPTQPLRQSTSVPVQQRPVADYVTRDIVTVDEQTPLAEVIDALVFSPVKRVVVVDADRRVRGIISDVDVLAGIHKEGRPGLLRLLAGWAHGKAETLTLQAHPGKAHVASDIMNCDVAMVSETASVQQTIEQMIATRRKVLPVIDAQDHLVGVVGRSDLLRVLLEG
jgi:CBS-domain-containing membrane protein